MLNRIRNSNILFLESFAIVFAQFCYLGFDNYSAVGLSRVLDIIFLVVVFGLVEFHVRHDLGDDWPLPDFRLLKLLNDLLCNSFLLRIVIKHSRPILGPNVCTLPVHCRGIMRCEEYS